MGADPTRPLSAAVLVFGLLCCLYAATGGGQGYSVDGQFSYLLSRSLASDPRDALTGQNRDTLKRWGPVVPALGVPFTWLGARLAGAAPWRDSVPLAGQNVRLYDWPPIGPGDGSSSTFQPELTVPATEQPIRRLRLVSYLSFAASLPDGAEVAQVHLRRQGAAGDVATLALRAGHDTSEWAYDVPGADRPQHRRAPLAGHWPGNPRANLYGALLDVPASSAVDQVVIRYTAPVGRLHVQAVVLEGPNGSSQVPGPTGWSQAQQQTLFTRFGFSFLNAPLMALTCALLVPLARLLGYTRRTAILFAAGFGLSTLAWPYAKLDFAETATAALATLSTVLALTGAHTAAATTAWHSRRCRLSLSSRAQRGTRRFEQGPSPTSTRRSTTLLVLAGAVAALAAGAKYTAAWFVPLLAAEVLLVTWPCGARRALGVAARFVSLPLLGLAGALALTHGGPTLWVDLHGALNRGWLDFSPWQGLYGLLLSPGKSVFLYAPPLLLAVAGAAAFVRRHRQTAFLFCAVPALYLVVFASKGVWSGGGWGPRYLVPALPFAACLALPVVDRAVRRGGLVRVAVLAVVAVGVAPQVLGVAKHPNLYTIMFRDHVLPELPAYGAPLGGPPALAYWRHFGGPGAARQLSRPPADPNADDPPRGLGYRYAEDGPLSLQIVPSRDGAFALSLYGCDWDHRGRRQRIAVEDAAGVRTYQEEYDFSNCEYLTWDVAAAANQPLHVTVTATGPDTPALSGLFFDPARDARQDAPRRDTSTAGAWPGRFGTDGYALFAWRRQSIDVAVLPGYVSSYRGGDGDWIDTGEADLEDTALLYAPAFSPLLAHAWLLGCDAIAILMPSNVALLQRALGSPPWRYLAGLEIHPAHPEYGLGLDFWPLLLRDQFSSHTAFMALVWTAEAALLAGVAACAVAVVHLLRRPEEV